MTLHIQLSQGAGRKVKTLISLLIDLFQILTTRNTKFLESLILNNESVFLFIFFSFTFYYHIDTLISSYIFWIIFCGCTFSSLLTYVVALKRNEDAHITETYIEDARCTLRTCIEAEHLGQTLRTHIQDTLRRRTLKTHIEDNIENTHRGHPLRTRIEE